MSETTARSLAKAITWRMTGTVDTFVISWFITGTLSLAVGIAFTEILTKVTLYWVHERVWNRIKWGEQPTPTQKGN